MLVILYFCLLLGKQDAYQILFSVLLKNEGNTDVIKDCLKALISLMTKQPDLLDDKGVELIIRYLDNVKDPEIQRLILKWTKECCIMHEMNRYILKYIL